MSASRTPFHPLRGAWLLLAWAAGCSSPPAAPDGGSGCPAGTKECVTGTLARVCPTDGSGWLGVQCRASERCVEGDCQPDPTARCEPETGVCLTSTTGLRCKDDGAGYLQVSCPAGTTCTGGGRCQGACTVGDSACLSPQTLLSCNDGKAHEPSSCPLGQLCVATGADSAACKPAECAPDVGGCDSVCGHKADPAADQTRFYSTCLSTPLGYRWVAVGCTAPQTCNPAARSCGGGRRQAACAATCTPGQMRCTSDGLATQVCTAAGEWGPSTACNQDPAQTGLTCIPAPTDPTRTVCADRLCAQGFAGACEADGRFRPCINGQLAAGAVGCDAGSCTATTSTTYGGHRPGVCAVTCVVGERRCTNAGSTTYQQCAANSWGPQVACPTLPDGGASRCFWRMDGNGNNRPATVCGECAPGTARCRELDGGTGTTAVQACDSAGQWGPLTGCQVGRCSAVGASSAGCLAECIPGETVCLGNAKSSGSGVGGTEAAGRCGANGMRPASPVGCPDAGGCCAENAACRRSAMGAALGCVECVGSSVPGGNERGEVDARCRATDGGAGVDHLQQCGAGNAWSSPLACVAPTACSTTGPSCSTCLGGPCTDSALRARGYTGGCAYLGRTAASCGATSDCCSSYCFVTSGVQAHCR